MQDHRLSAAAAVAVDDGAISVAVCVTPKMVVVVVVRSRKVPRERES